MTNVGHEVVHGGRGDDIAAIVQGCDMALLAIPFGATKGFSTDAAVMEELSGKILIDATNPVKSDWSPETDFGVEGVDDIQCAAQAIQHWFPQCKVVKAFNTIFADNFTKERLVVEGRRVSTFVAGNDDNARKAVVDLANQLGFDAVETGSLLTVRYLEAMAHLNIHLAVQMQRGTNTGFHYFDREAGSE